MFIIVSLVKVNIVMRMSVVGVGGGSEQVRYKPGCLAIKASQLERLYCICSKKIT